MKKLGAVSDPLKEDELLILCTWYTVYIGEMKMPACLHIFQKDYWDKGKSDSAGSLSKLKACRRLYILSVSIIARARLWGKVNNTFSTAANMAINGGPSALGVEWKAEVPGTAKIADGIRGGPLARMRPGPG